MESQEAERRDRISRKIKRQTMVVEIKWWNKPEYDTNIDRAGVC